MAAASTTVATDRPGAKARVRYVRMSASKVRVVLDLIRGKRVVEAIEILEFSERLAAQEVLKCLRSAVANAEHNEDIPESELFVSACFADEGPSLRRFRPRARGRAGRIKKQTCHITLDLRRLTDDELDELRQRSELREAGRSKKSKGSRSSGGDRAKRVARSKAAAATDDDTEKIEPAAESEAVEAEAVDAADDTEAEDGAVEDSAVEESAVEEEETAEAEDSTESEDTDSEDAVDDEDNAVDEAATEAGEEE